MYGRAAEGPVRRRGGRIGTVDTITSLEWLDGGTAQGGGAESGHDVKWPRYAEGTKNTECAMTSVDGDCTRYTIGTLYRARPIQHAKADEMDHDGSDIMPVMECGMRK